MSRARKNESPAHRKERDRNRLRAAEKRLVSGIERRQIATALYRRAERMGSRRRVWWHIPRSWRRRLERGERLVR